MPKIILPDLQKELFVADGSSLLEALQKAAFLFHAPCGGKGTCGKCKVIVNGEEESACRIYVHTDIVVQLPKEKEQKILSYGISMEEQTDKEIEGTLIAIDLGTTTVVCYLLDKNGKELAVASMANPQSAYGADVISRMQAALDGKQSELCCRIREGLTELIQKVCRKSQTDASLIQRIVVVGNPCMQQLLLDISPENLTKVPFAPVLTQMQILPAKQILPICPNGIFLVVPDISGYVGADTIGCILATKLYEQKGYHLLIDIGTNGEMVLGNSTSMVACATAAGPALEGASIHFGMRGSAGAIDQVEWKNNKVKVHTIGEGTARGICGSGLIDAVALLLQLGILNKRGRLGTGAQFPQFAKYLKEIEGERCFFLTDKIYLTQGDIRQVQLAKGAIAAGIELMIKQCAITLEEIEEVLLAGAFGSYIRPESACRIGLFPPILLSKIRAIGNGAGSGAKLLAGSKSSWKLTELLTEKITFLELASLPDFQRSFGRNTKFSEREGD